MTNFSEEISSKINEIFSKENLKTTPKKIAVAVSGGSDSLALTFALNDFCKKNKIKLFAITINHKMREASNLEAKSLNKIFAKQKIAHQILEINWQKKPQSNIESKLRQARYHLLNEFCSKNKIKYLFLGHQLDDVAENFLIRLFRGSGLDGLSSIAEISDFEQIKLVRPLLDITKNQLQAFLNAKKIKWFEDESNLDEKFLRNKIRNFINSFPEENLIKKRIKKAADEISKTRDLFDHKMNEETADIFEFQENKVLLNLEKFKNAQEKFALKALALVMVRVSKKPYKPRLEKLKLFYNWIISDKAHKPRDFYGCSAKKYNNSQLEITNENIQ
jgi:tRNA(Ile)-lysidine synthase